MIPVKVKHNNVNLAAHAHQQNTIVQIFASYFIHNKKHVAKMDVVIACCIAAFDYLVSENVGALVIFFRDDKTALLLEFNGD